MLVVGLTGGIGSGKTTFASFLEELGATIIDADELGRVALEPGQPAWHSVVDTFGDEILSAGGMAIDRKALARIVFNDRDALAALNAIVHPQIVRTIADTLETLAGTDETVVVDAALLIDLGLAEGLDAVVVVSTQRTHRAERLVRDRGMDPADVDARIAAQLDPQALEEKADILVRNDGSLEDLRQEAERVWELLEDRKRARS